MTLATAPILDLAEIKALYADLHRFGVRLRETAQTVNDLSRSDNLGLVTKEVPFNANDPHDSLRRSIDITQDFQFMVAVTGAFSSGKSTLLNLLLDVPDLLPASVIPMTAVCTVIRYGAEPRAEVRYVERDQCWSRMASFFAERMIREVRHLGDLDEARRHPERFVESLDDQASLRRFADLVPRLDALRAAPISFEARAPYIAGGGVIANAETNRYYRPTPKEQDAFRRDQGDPSRWVEREWLALVRDVTLWVPSALLKNDIVLLDLPGLNCREDYHRRAVQEYCHMADCVMVVAFQPGNQADQEVIANFKKLSRNYSEKLFFVFNKVDQFRQEPQELVHAIDYLARDTIGGDFPPDRFFLTSGHLARSHSAGDTESPDELSRLRVAFDQLENSPPNLTRWMDGVTQPDDPGGLQRLRSQMCTFLGSRAYQTKLNEVMGSLGQVVGSVRGALSPQYEEYLRMDPRDLLRKSVLEYLRETQHLQKKALHRFRHTYLRQEEGAGGLRNDLKIVLEDVHQEIIGSVRSYFDQPILTMPISEDPVSDFDLLMIADQATARLQRELRDQVIQAIHARLQRVFTGMFEEEGVPGHLGRLLRGSPEMSTRATLLLERFQETMLHSLKCIVRDGFYHMPRGRHLRRLERTIPRASLKELLVEIFTDFYPAWIYENIYGQVLDRLWLSLYLDCEDLEEEFGTFFRAAEDMLSGTQLGEKAEIPDSFREGSRDLQRAVRLCQEVEGLVSESEELASRATRLGGGA